MNQYKISTVNPKIHSGGDTNIAIHLTLWAKTALVILHILDTFDFQYVQFNLADNNKKNQLLLHNLPLTPIMERESLLLFHDLILFLTYPSRSMRGLSTPL